MKIKIVTNLDKYQTNCFPDNLQYVPRVGEYIMIDDVFNEYYHKQCLPTTLKVVSVTHSNKLVLVEVNYSDIQIKSAKLNNINLY